MLNLQKYKNKKFHDSTSINKKIEALFLLYDKRVLDSNLEYKDKIKLINIFIHDLINFEEYEVAEAFKNRKYKKYKKYRKFNRKWTIFLFCRLITFKVNRIIAHL